jgi:hypothetical protein
MQVLNKYEKEQLVIKLHQDGQTIRDIASAAHLSFGDIGKIIKKVDGSTNDFDTDLSNNLKQLRRFICSKAERNRLMLQ